MVTSFPFSEKRIRALDPPTVGPGEYKQEFHKDTICPGLQVCVSSAGAKVYYYVKRMDGKPTRVKLGTTEELSVDNARKAATAKSAVVASGKNPHAERRAKLHEQTIADLWTMYLDLHAKPRKRSWRDDERMYDKYMGDLHNKRLSAITQPVVAKWHGTLAKDHGPIQANRCKALLATMFSKASRSVGYAGPNPAVGVANFPERSRERFLLPAEMQAFFTAMATEDPYWQAFFLLCLLTGARRGNVASMAWAEINLEGGTWHVPADKTKNKRPAVIALCDPALAILRTRHENRTSCPWVFPAFKGPGHMADPRKAWERILKEAKIDDLRMHDLRRTQGSWQAAMGISLAIIGKSLGHADLKSTQTYSRLSMDPVKDAVGRSATAMFTAGKMAIGEDGTVKLLEAKKEGDKNV